MLCHAVTQHKQQFKKDVVGWLHVSQRKDLLTFKPEWLEKPNTSIEQQFCGQKCLADERSVENSRTGLS